MRRGLSIKAKVTLWYVFFMLLLLGMTAFLLLSVSRRVSTQRIREQLVDVVTDSVQQIRFRYGKLNADNVDFYRNGVSVFIYDTQGRLLAPPTTRGFGVDSLLEDQVVKTAGGAGDRWMIYDVYAVQGGQAFWVRGMVSLSEYGQAFGAFQLLFLAMLPAFAAVAAFGGWRITKRAFLPVRQIAETAKAISSGNDLSERIVTDRRGDEISDLGDTMNAMFERLQASFEGERQFSSDVSHELRTPIAAVRAQCELALSDAVSEEERTHALWAIFRQTERMTSLVSQLLMLARAENGLFQPERETVDFGELCEAVCLDLAPAAEAQGLYLSWETAGHATVTGDETLLLRLVSNLVTNAIRYNREGGSVHLSLNKQGALLVLTVDDTGIGIPKESLDQIWNRFYRVDRSRTGEGTGLGLSMVRWIAELHGGSAAVESEEGAGSRFTVLLPVGPEEETT